MKKLTSTLILVCAAIAATLSALSACGPKGPATIPVLDVTKTYPAKTLTLQDIATVEYIPLETREGFLIDYFVADYIDDEIVITNNHAGDIMTFDRKTGKGLHSFNRTGRGPGEYNSVGQIAVDKRGGEIYVTPGSYNSRMSYPMYVYDMQGKPLRTIEYPNAHYSGSIHDYDTNHLFAYNSVRPKVRDTDPDPNPHPYALLSKTDSLITPLPVRFEGRQSALIALPQGEMVILTGRISGFVARALDGYLLSEPGIDTLYRLNKTSGELTPFMTRTPSFASMEYPIGVFLKGEFGDYIFFETAERRYVPGQRPDEGETKLFYDKRTDEFYEGTLVNGDYVDQTEVVWHETAGIPAGRFVVALQPYELLELHEQGKLRGRLAEIAPTLKEEDNPVMMIVTFK
jgi:predicted small lipoprotein YifL